MHGDALVSMVKWPLQVGIPNLKPQMQSAPKSKTS